MKKNIAYKFRLYPNLEQEIAFAKTFDSCRFIYNKMLEDLNIEALLQCLNFVISINDIG